MRDLAVHVMKHVRLRDAVCGRGTDPAHDAAKVAEEVAVQSREGAAREGELARTVVWEEGVGVLQERDQDEPVVDPAVSHEWSASLPTAPT